MNLMIKAYHLHCTRSSFSSRIWLFLCECNTFGNGCFSHQLRFTDSSSVVPESHSQLDMSFLSFDRSTDTQHEIHRTSSERDPSTTRGVQRKRRPKEGETKKLQQRPSTRRMFMILTAYLFVGDICRFRLQTSTVAWIPSGTAPLRRRCPKYLCNFTIVFHRHGCNIKELEAFFAALLITHVLDSEGFVPASRLAHRTRKFSTKHTKPEMTQHVRQSAV